MSSAASNGPDEAATKQSSFTLSRNALYAPLVAYEQQNVDPSAYMTTRKNVPSSLRESSLVDFIQSVSVKNSGKPLSTKAVEERIRQRALTLVGGGINSSMTGKQNKRKQQRHHEELSNRQRKRILKEAKEKRQEEDSKKKSKEQDEKAFSFLLQINQKWNIYIRKLAGVEKLMVDDDAVLTDSSRKALSSRLAQVELVGAFVKIIECKAHKEWVGKEGVVVVTTTNTWRLAIMKVSVDLQQKQRPKVLVVPKHGSQLVFQLPIKDGSTPLCIVVHGDRDKT